MLPVKRVGLLSGFWHPSQWQGSLPLLEARAYTLLRRKRPGKLFIRIFEKKNDSKRISWITKAITSNAPTKSMVQTVLLVLFEVGGVFLKTVFSLFFKEDRVGTSSLVMDTDSAVSEISFFSTLDFGILFIYFFSIFLSL